MAPPYAGPVGPSSTAPGSPPSLGSSSGIQRQTGQPVTLPPTGPVGPASAIPGSFGASRLASAAGPPQGSPMPGSVPSSPSLAGHGYPPPMPHQQMPPPSPGQPQQPNALADLVPKTHRTVSMGRKKKIELFEKDEPSRTLPNYEFEKRKWDAYNELRQGASYRKAASQYNISYRCLFDYARGKRNRVESHERYMALPVELETELSNQIMGIVEQTGVFPQQKVISQLANELIRRSQNNPSASAAAGGPGGSPKSQGAGSSGSPGSDSAGSSTADPPVRPKPAVSDTWVSKFLRRHPELNYEKRTKRRKLDACVGTSPVVGSTDAGSGASSAKTRAGSISPSTSVEAVSSSSSSVSSSSHHHHSHLQQQAQQQHMVHHTVGGISGPPGVMHSAHQSPVMHHPQQQQQQQQQHLPHPNLMGGAPPQYAPGLAGMGRPVPATLPPITGQVPYIQGHPQQQQPQQQQPQQQQQQQQQQDQQQQPYPLPPIHSYPPQVQQQQQLTPQPQQQQMVPMSPAQQQRNMIHYNNNQYHNNYYYNQPPPQQQQPQHYSSSVHQPIQNNYYSSPNGAMQSKGHSSSPTFHQVAQQQPLPQQHQQQALQPMSHPQQPNQQLPTKAQQHQGLSPQQPPASPGRAKSLRRSNLQHWFNGLNRNIDSLSIRPGDIYNARVLNFKIDGGKCVVVRGGRVDEAWAESSSSGTASIFECICTDGTCLESVASVSGAGSRSLGSIPGVHVLGGVASRHEGLGFFEWLRGHFDRQTGSKANSSWRVLIIEECESIDLFHFLWAFKRRILIVTVPSSSARTIQPIERGSVIDLLCKRLKSSLKEYAHSRDGEGASGSKGSRSPASTSPQLENLVVNLRSPSRSNESSSSSTSLKSVFDLAGFLTTYGVVHGEAFTTDNIVSGWKQTGILPRNPNLVIDSVSKRDGCENGEKEEEDEEKDDEDDDDEEGEERAGEVLIDVSLEMNDSEEETIKESSKAVPLDGMGSLGAQRASPFKAVELLESGIEALEDPNLSGEERSQKLFSLLGQAFEDAVEWNLSRHMGASASLLRHLRRSSSDSASQAILEGAGGSARWSSEGREDGSEGEGVLILRQETVRGDGLRKKSTSKDGSEVEIKREEGSDEEYLRAGQGNGAATAGANGKGEEGTGGEEHADGREEKRGGDGEGEGEGGEDEESSLSRRREEQLMLPELSVELGTKIRRYLHPSWVSRERRRGRRAVSQTLRESVSGGGTTVEEGIITVEQVVTALLRFIESDGSRS